MSQKSKVFLEEIQRNDRNLRENNKQLEFKINSFYYFNFYNYKYK